MTASDSTSWRDRYLTLIEQIVTDTLQGKIRSKNQVARRLSENLSAGTGEIFERCLEEQLSQVQEQLNSQTDELKQAKANRQLTGLKQKIRTKKDIILTISSFHVKISQP